jgi:hypothetical protein
MIKTNSLASRTNKDSEKNKLSHSTSYTIISVQRQIICALKFSSRVHFVIRL